MHDDREFATAMHPGSPARRPRRPRRGSAYVVVLGAAMIVTVLGFSAVQATRVQRRASAGDEAAVKARFYAESTIDVVRYRLDNSPTWRSIAINNAWTPLEVVGEATLSYRVVDEGDANLTNNATDPVRLTAKATVGNTMRMFSVLLQPQQSASVNLLANADMENGTSSWYLAGTGNVASSSTDPHGGASCLDVYGRANYWSVPAQDIIAFVQNGVAYDFTIWVKLSSGSQQVTPQIVINSSIGGWMTFDPTSTFCAAGTWTQVTSTITPTWSGSLLHASARVGTQTSHQFWIDDALLVEAGAPSPPLQPVAGTWQRQVQ